VSTGTTYKQCGCRDAATGRPLGRKCPRLRRGGGWNPDHGTWYYQLELPAHADGTRCPPLRAGGFATKTVAETDLGAARDLLAVPDASAPGIPVSSDLSALSRAEAMGGRRGTQPACLCGHTDCSPALRTRVASSQVIAGRAGCGGAMAGERDD
jgi:hypothetical protein